uniref:WGS project CAEQ00000000 data, annotated contig 2111 n=1 Tax=Trypanosoma congolense (strain IL3000) TaxID=1068625 RepID=F9WBI9_TRYCI|nr:unnamed protein product [Trypanosoma congolense IL3000]
MCSRLLLFMAEKMGYFPAADHYYMLLRSCLDSGLTFAEREFCAKNLKHLSHSINERQIINLVSSIGSSGMLHSSQCDENDHLISRSQIITHHEGKKRRFTSAGVWLTGDRPPLNPEELQRLCEVAPLIIVLSSHDMERLSRQFLGGRFASFELALLLHHYRLEVMESVEKGSDNFVNTELVEHCRKSKLVHILLLRYERPSRRVLRSGNKCSVRSFLEMIRWEVFKGLASVRTVALVWEVSLPSVSALAASRWSRVCEYELLTEVRRRAGRPPKSLSTRPSAARVEIAKYWSTYGRIVWPELFFSGPELCQIAVYVPLLESLLTREDHLLDLVSGIHASHFAAHSIPNEERLFRAPRSMEAIRAVINLVFSGLKRLHAELEVDSRGERRYYRYEPNKELWERIERDMQRRQGVPENSLIHTETEYRIPRWSLALHILHHYKRSTRATLDARTLAVLFSACAADVAEMKHIDSIGQQQEKQSTTWWMLAICCAQCVEPNLTHAVWRSAIQLTSLTQVSKLQTTPPTETYKVEDIGDISLRATMRVVLCQAASVGRGGRIPFPTSLLLVEQLKELLADSLCFSPPSSSGIYQGGSDAGEHDALVVWHLLQSHHCFDKMEPLHVKLLQRVVLEDYDMSGDVECDGRGGGVLQLAFED